MAEENAQNEEAQEAETPETPEENDEEQQSKDLTANLAQAIGEDGETLNMKSVYEIPVQVTAVLGRTSMSISQLLKMGRGAVVELDRRVGEAVDVYVNDRLIAKGEVVIVEDRIGITMTEIIKAGEK